MTNNKAAANIVVKTGENVTVQATDGETGATAQLTLTVDWVMAPEQPEPPQPEPEPPAEGSALWLAPLEATASSMETGDIVQVTAWGGDEYGYAYTYSLVEAPGGVAIDADTGRLRIETALGVGDKTFGIVATNREDPSKAAGFDFTLHVFKGITSGTPTATQILHKTYDPHSGTWGKPTNNDWSTVFTAMGKAIRADQTTCNAVADESLRATIPLKRGRVYQYYDNLWLNGIQYLEIYATGSGALPVMMCTRASPSTQQEGPMNQTPSAGAGQAPGAISHQDHIKEHCAAIATVGAGSAQVELLSAGDASKIKVGRWHVVLGSATQFVSYPPNVAYIDYAKVTAVDGTTITLDRPLKYGYDQTWWEPTSGQYADQTLGLARIASYDSGGEGGQVPSDPRCGIRNSFINIEFGTNPNATPGVIPPGNTVGCGCSIDLVFNGCKIPCLQASRVKHLVIKNCTATYPWELDKEAETVLFDGVTATRQVIGGATGFQYALFRDSEIGLIQLSPRQLRAIDTSFDGTGDGSIPGAGGVVGCPVTFGYLGALEAYDFGSAGPCHFIKGGSNVWAPAYDSRNNSSAVTLGTNARWNGNQLQVTPDLTDSSYFERWVGWAVPGAIVSVNPAAPFSTNWGYVVAMSSPGDGTMLWLDIDWVQGSKPASGQLWILQGQRLTFAEGNTFAAGTGWASPGWAKQVAPGRDEDWDFPQGYPPELAG